VRRHPTGDGTGEVSGHRRWPTASSPRAAVAARIFRRDSARRGPPTRRRGRSRVRPHPQDPHHAGEDRGRRENVSSSATARSGTSTDRRLWRRRAGDLVVVRPSNGFWSGTRTETLSPTARSAALSRLSRSRSSDFPVLLGHGHRSSALVRRELSRIVKYVAPGRLPLRGRRRRGEHRRRVASAPPAGGAACAEAASPRRLGHHRSAGRHAHDAVAAGGRLPDEERDHGSRPEVGGKITLEATGTTRVVPSSRRTVTSVPPPTGRAGGVGDLGPVVSAAARSCRKAGSPVLHPGRLGRTTVWWRSDRVPGQPTARPGPSSGARRRRFCCSS